MNCSLSLTMRGRYALTSGNLGWPAILAEKRLMVDESNAASSPHPYRWPTAAIVGLVLLRLALGWHFFSEGSKKLIYSKTTGQVELNVPTAALFLQARGPLAPYFKSQVPGFHDWQDLLVVPRSWEETEASETSPSAAWQERIEANWRDTLEKVVKTPGLSDEQQAAAAEIYEKRVEDLAYLLAEERTAIAEMQHEYWRLEQWKEAPQAGELPFHDERIAEKEAELRSEPLKFVSLVRTLQGRYYDELRSLVDAEERGEVPINEALEDPEQRRLDWMNLAVTSLLIGAGALLMLGLFTRLAAVGAMAFLLTVMATQPPWVAGAMNPNFGYQLVEVAALVTMICTAAGRWAGLDFFIHRCCGSNKTAA